ncbi:hypothetical protein BC940DRAFT_346163 [Gongronella butleri]|nr:hypothetical protein BC940DRAFT_346163 [Gongronella butleri]
MSDVVDMDIDLDLAAAAAGLEPTTSLTTDSTLTTLPDPSIPAIYNEDESNERSNAIYMHGVNDMSTADVRAFCKDTALDKVEWVDDSSCVLVFSSAELAMEAAEKLLLSPETTTWPSLTELCTARPFEREQPAAEPATGENGAIAAENEVDPSKPPVKAVVDTLKIRVAKLTDAKSKGSRERSRYYLFHGTKDSNVTSVFDRLGPKKTSHRKSPYDASDRHDRRRRRHSDDDDNENRDRRDRRHRNRRRDRSPRSSSSGRLPYYDMHDHRGEPNAPVPAENTKNMDTNNDAPNKMSNDLRGRLGPTNPTLF